MSVFDSRIGDRMDEFGVFKGLPHMKPFQLGVVSDVERANDLMARLNQRIPGAYFVRNMITDVVVACIHPAPADSFHEESENNVQAWNRPKWLAL